MHMIETPQSSQIESAGHENDVLHVLFRSGRYTLTMACQDLFLST